MTAKINFGVSPAGTFTILLITGILGYLVYDCDVTSAIGVVGISIVVGLVTLLSLIPIIGWVISVLLSYYWVIPSMLEITGLEYTWLIMAIFVANVFLGLIITTTMTAITIKTFIVWRRINER